MKKKAVTLIICAVILLGFTTAYFIISDTNDGGEALELAGDDGEKGLSLVSRDKSLIESIALSNQDADFIFVHGGAEADTWAVDGKENWKIISSYINSLADCFGEFAADRKLETENLTSADFGFAEPIATATAKYTDGVEETLLIGTLTPDKEYAYIMRKGDDSIYLINNYTAQNFLRTRDGLTDKTLPSITVNDTAYFYVNQNGFQTVELILDDNGDETGETDYSVAGLIMTQPYEGRGVYLSEFEAYGASNLSSLTLSELVELEPEDYGKYGLDEPELELKVKSVYGDELHLYVGGDTGDGYVYCRIGGRDETFVISSDKIEPFFNINVFKFIDRFAADVDIKEVNQVTVEYEADKYILKPNRDTVEDTDVSGVETAAPTVNGEPVDEPSFMSAYEAIVGICYDAAIESTAVGGSPAVKVTYELNTGNPNVILRLHAYNDDFYMIEDTEGAANFVCNEMSVRAMLGQLEALANNN